MSTWTRPLLKIASYICLCSATLRTSFMSINSSINILQFLFQLTQSYLSDQSVPTNGAGIVTPVFALCFLLVLTPHFFIFCFILDDSAPMKMNLPHRNLKTKNLFFPCGVCRSLSLRMLGHHNRLLLHILHNGQLTIHRFLIHIHCNAV